MKKALLFCLFLFLLAPAPGRLFARENSPQDQIFQARVVEIAAEEAGKQHLLLVGLSGGFVGQEFEFNALDGPDLISAPRYKPGDKVLAVASYSPAGAPNFYVIDHVRLPQIGLLAALFILVLLLVGRFKGLRSLFALAFTFLIIIKYLIPRMLAGGNPLVITLIGSFAILLVIIYITEGFRARSHLAVLSIGLSLGLTIVLSYAFVFFSRLSGAGSEEVLFLFNIEGAAIDLGGLLLAGIIIGTLGVLDDVVISQVATVEEIKRANTALDFKALYQKAYRVGVSHIASMANTLFLAYAGASLPLLILFVSGTSAFGSWQEAVNTELIATEIIRALAGSIGLVLAVPIATFIASKYYSRR